MKKTIFIIPLLALIMTSCGGSGEQNPTGPIGPTQGPATSGVGPTSSNPNPSTSGSLTNQPEVLSVTLNTNFIEINLNDDDKTAVLVASVEVKNNAPKSVTYTTTNDHIAHVTSAGFVIATGAGYATIRATSTYDATKYAECTVRVIRPQDYAFDPSTVLEAGVKRYTGSAISGSDTIDFVFEGATFDGTRFCIDEDKEAYFYNTTPIEGINNASYTMQASYASASCSSFLSYNELSLANIIGGKYSDLFAYVASQNDYIPIYDEYTLSMNQTQMPQLRNYRYFLIHIVASSNPIYISMMNIRDDCAAIPEIPVGINEGVYTANEIATIRSKTANSVTPTKTGNGAYTVSPYSEFGISQFLPFNERTYFETDLLNSGFALTSSASSEGFAYYLYQKQIGDVVHSFNVQYLDYANFRYMSVTYGTDMGLIVRTQSWPTEFLSQNLREEHYSVFPALVSDKIDAFECMVSVTPSGKNVVINAIMKSGQVFTETDLNTYMALLNPANFTNDYTYSIDGLMRLQINGIDSSAVNFVLIEYPKYDVPPTASEIAHTLSIDSLVSKIKVFTGDENSYYYHEYYIGDYSYYTSAVYNTSAAAVDAFKDILLATGYEVMSDNVYYMTTDIYGSYLYLSIVNGNVPNSYFFTYSFSNQEAHYDHFATFSEMVDDWYNQHYYNNTEVITSIKTHVSTLPAYTYRGNKNQYFVLNAGEEFLAQLSSIAGLTGHSVPSLRMYYFDNDNSTYVYARIIDEGVALTFGDYPMFELFDYTKFNMYMDSWGAPSGDIFHLAESDNIPAQFTSDGFIGTKEEVEHLHDLLVSKIEATHAFTYSRLLDEYVDVDDQYSIEVSIQKYPPLPGTDLCFLRIYLGYDEYDEYKAYNDYPVTDLTLVKNFMNHYPELPFNKDAKIIHGLLADTTHMDFEVEGNDLSYLNAIRAAGFTSTSNYGPYYKVIDGQLYCFSIDLRNRTVFYQFRNYGDILTSSEVYGYDYNHYNDFLDTFNFTTYFTSSTPAYVVTNAYQEQHEQRFDLIMFANNASEVDNYRTHILENGFEYSEENGKYIKYSDQYHYSYQAVSFGVDGDILRVNFEIVDSGYKTWPDFIASLTDYNISDHISQVPFPDFYDGEQIFSLQSENENSIDFYMLKVVDLGTYLDLLRNHTNRTEYNEGVFDFHYYFSDGSEVHINAYGEQYASVYIYTPQP